MFDNIVVGVDGTPSGRDAIALANALAAPGARLTLALVYGPETTPREAQALLAVEEAATGTGGELAFVRGSSAGHALHELARDQHGDLLVVGSCHRGALGRLLLGDDTRDSLNNECCPVAVAPRDFRERGPAIATIGVGYDFTPASEGALAAACALGKRSHAAVIAMHVTIPPITSGAAIGEYLDELLDEHRMHAEQRLAALPGVRTHVSVGIPAVELGRLSKDVDLLIIGSRYRSYTQLALHGSTCHRLAHLAFSPLLVVPTDSSATSRPHKEGTFVTA